MYLQKVISDKPGFFLHFKATDENSRSRILKSVVRIRGSGSVLKCHGFIALIATVCYISELWLPGYMMHPYQDFSSFLSEIWRRWKKSVVHSGLWNKFIFLLHGIPEWYKFRHWDSIGLFLWFLSVCIAIRIDRFALFKGVLSIVPPILG